VKIRYRIIPQEDRTYSIEVKEAESDPYTVPGFKSEAEAEIWAAERAGKSMDQWERQFDPDRRY
jgi:hypothetical protein